MLLSSFRQQPFPLSKGRRHRIIEPSNMEKGCDDMSSVLLAVNGTLMRGLELEKTLLDVGAVVR